MEKTRLMKAYESEKGKKCHDKNNILTKDYELWRKKNFDK